MADVRGSTPLGSTTSRDSPDLRKRGSGEFFVVCGGSGGSARRTSSGDPVEVTVPGSADLLGDVLAPDGARAGAHARTRPVDRALPGELVTDGRMGWSELAQRTRISPATVRRRLRRPTDAEVLTFRCDIAGVHRTVAALPECRPVAAVTGTDNLLATLWCHDIGDIQRRETALCARAPSLAFTGRPEAGPSLPGRQGAGPADQAGNGGGEPLRDTRYTTAAGRASRARPAHGVAGGATRVVFIRRTARERRRSHTPRDAYTS
ncbi:Lrp/AsnC family transcriptional regulator [Streptomyces sp. NPDC002867]